MSKICIGCGKILQNINPLGLGYTPDMKNDYCKRCFRLKNYGEKKENEEVLVSDILKKVNNKKGMAFFFVDFLNINRDSILLFNKILLPKVFVVSKSDILRKEMKSSKIKKWLYQVYKIEEPILFISNKTYKDSQNIFKFMNSVGYNSAFIMGVTNAGKTTFINKILKNNGINLEILSSNKPNTTLDLIKIKVGEYTIYDTPGFPYMNDQYLITKEIKMFTYNIKAGTTLVVDDYRFYFNKNNRITFYTNSNHKRLYKDEKLKYSLIVPENYDIVIPGIGFINIKEKANVYSNKNDLEIRCDISEVEHE